VRLILSLSLFFFKVSYISYTMPRNCVNNPNNFCYICRAVTYSTRKLPLTPMVKKSYESYFSCKVGDQDKKWAPHVCCISCATNLREWLNNKGRSFNAFCPSHDMERTNGPFDRLLFLYSSASLSRNYKEKKRGLSIILIFHLLFDRYPTPKTSLFQYHHSSIF